jgi:hypothetical protein
MKFRKTKFREIIHFVFREILIIISRNFLLSFRENLQNFVWQNVGNFEKFSEMFATEFRFLLDEVKKFRPIMVNKKNNVVFREI